MPLEELDQDRRRRLMAQVLVKVKGWQQIYMSSELDSPSSAKGRYQAAKEFYDWLADGGDIAKAQEYLNQRSEHWSIEEEVCDRMSMSAQLANAIAQGWETKESLKGYAHLLVDDDQLATEEERQRIHFLKWQFRASQTELWHLVRFLK